MVLEMIDLEQNKNNSRRKRNIIESSMRFLFLYIFIIYLSTQNIYIYIYSYKYIVYYLKEMFLKLVFVEIFFLWVIHQSSNTNLVFKLNCFFIFIFIFFRFEFRSDSILYFKQGLFNNDWFFSTWLYRSLKITWSP